MRKLLQVNKSPILNAYSGDANRTSIMDCYIGYDPVIILNGTQLVYLKDIKSLVFAWTLSHDTFDLGEEHFVNIEEESKYINCLTSFIDEKLYIELYLSHYFVVGSDAFHNKHRLHWSLIYGYDDGKEVFYCGDNFDAGKYLLTEVPFANIKESRQYVIKQQSHELKKIKVFNYHPVSKYEFTVQQLCELINSYLNSRSNSDDINCVFGLKSYDCVIENILLRSKEQMEIDVRPFHVWFNQKNIFLKTVKHLETEMEYHIDKSIKDRFKELSELALVTRNLALKYNVTKRIIIINKILANIDEMRNGDYNCLVTLLKCIEFK